MQATEDITIQSPTVTTDPYGDDETDWTDPTETTLQAIVYPRTSSEDNDKRTATITGLTVLLPPDATIAATDRVVARGGTWEVDGESGDWSAPWGWQPGQQVDLRKVEG